MIRLEHLTVAYEGRTALRDVTGTFEAGSMTAIVGPNGAGKSTMMKALVGEKTAVSGRVEFGEAKRDLLGYLPQVAEIDRSFPLSVADTVLLGAWPQSGAFGRVSDEMRRRGRSALATVGLDGFEARPVGALSAGQFRRVLFARLLLQNAQALLLDEPFAAVDARTTGDLLALVHRWHREGRTIIAVLHDIEQVRAHFPRTLLLAREAIAWGETKTTLTAENLMRARALSDVWDGADGRAPLRHVA